MRCWSVFILILMGFTAPVVLAAEPVDEVVEAAYPRIAELASGIVLATWSERVAPLLSSAPSAAVAGERWQEGDPHWAAARSRLLAHIESWVRELAADSRAREIVRHEYSRALSPAQASTIVSGISKMPDGGFLDANDAIHLGVAFSVAHPQLKAGSQEFSTAFSRWLQSGRIEVENPTRSTEVDLLLRSEAGMAFDRGRGNAIRSLVSGLNGQIELLLNDRQAALLEEIGADASACAAGH